MKKTYKVLIIDDHPAIVDGFKNALEFITKQDALQHFHIETAFNCETAYRRITETANSKLDLVILDISLPPYQKHKIESGEDLGVLVKRQYPKTKILVCTFYQNKLRLQQIENRLKPEGFICKSDMDVSGFVTAIKNVLKYGIYYSRTITKTLKEKSSYDFKLDKLDVLILKELANASKMKELLELIPLSKSAILKRIKQMKMKFETNDISNRDLVLLAKTKGLI